nr:TetR family transcriptional regulator [Actinomycetales bacterium]
MTLSREDVVRAAMAVLGEEGHGALSMRRVARKLGVSPMALYNHVENRADLVDAIAESFLRWTHEEGGTLIEQARDLFNGYRRWPYMLDVVREADPRISRDAAESVVAAAGGGPARTREDWAALRALAEGLSTADDVDAPAVLARAAAALTA